MTDIKSDAEVAAGKAGQIWSELLPVISFVAIYNIIRIADLDLSFSLGGLEIVINRDTALYWATGVLVILTVGLVVQKRMKGETVPLFMLLSAGIIGTFGLIGIILQDKGFIYVKPSIQQLVLATIIFGSLAAGHNIWKTMFSKVFELPERIWTIFAVRWGAYFVVMALANEFIWRYFAPGLEQPLSIFGIQLAPAGSYQLLGIEFGSRNMEDVWATWWKLATWFITMAFILANTPLMLKHIELEDDATDTPSVTDSKS